MRSLATFVLFLSIGCATAGGEDDNDIPPPISADASTSFAPDAAPLADAMTPDAEPQQTVDSGIPGGGFCEDNSDCNAPGECCVIALCAPGTEVGNVCIPD